MTATDQLNQATDQHDTQVRQLLLSLAEGEVALGQAAELIAARAQQLADTAYQLGQTADTASPIDPSR